MKDNEIRFIIESTEYDSAKRWILAQLRVNDQFTTIERFTYKFTPNAFGTVIHIVDNLTKDETDITDYSLL